MARARHAMRVHPLRSKGVVVGVPVAAAVAFGAHAVLGVTPLSDQHDTQASSSARQADGSPASAGGPVQTYGLAATPPPTTLGLLSAPSAAHGSTSHGSGSPAGTGSVAGASGSSRAAAPARTVPITAAPGAPAPSMMTFTPAAAAAVPGAAAAPATSAPPASPQTAEHAAAPAATTAAEEHDGGSSDGGSSGGSLLGVDLGVAKVSLLSFGG